MTAKFETALNEIFSICESRNTPGAFKKGFSLDSIVLKSLKTALSKISGALPNSDPVAKSIATFNKSSSGKVMLSAEVVDYDVSSSSVITLHLTTFDRKTNARGTDEVVINMSSGDVSLS